MTGWRRGAIERLGGNRRGVWLSWAGLRRIIEQTLLQQGGYRMTLLAINDEDGDDDGEEEDALVKNAMETIAIHEQTILHPIDHKAFFTALNTSPAPTETESQTNK